MDVLFVNFLIVLFWFLGVVNIAVYFWIDRFWLGVLYKVIICCDIVFKSWNCFIILGILVINGWFIVIYIVNECVFWSLLFIY